MAKRRFGVSIPKFDPEVDAFHIEVGEEEYIFVADFTVIREIERINTNSGVTQDGDTARVDAEHIIDILVAGLKRNHPDITHSDVEDWFQNPRALQIIGDQLGQYMQHVTSGMDADGQGEDLRTGGSRSGVTEYTTSDSRRKK